MKYMEIRCPEHRPHGNFDACGGLMGGIDITHEASVIFRCGKCGSVYEVTVTKDSDISLQKQTRKIPMTTKWRQIKNAR
jgi:DNA-directed RNA polymerase subunit RPC12/RpoP